MSQTSRSDYFKTVQYHYRRAADLAGKSALLDSAERFLGVGRKYLIRKLGQATDSRPARPRSGRPVGMAAIWPPSADRWTTRARASRQGF
jgi:hypothetical protein